MTSLCELERRFDWRRTQVVNQNVSPRATRRVPASFGRRIAEDNPADMEFFEHAVRLCDQRADGPRLDELGLGSSYFPLA
jgi:hypothetical protein